MKRYRGWTRRQFLRWAATSSAGALLAACGAERLLPPDPTTSAPTATPLPANTPAPPAQPTAEQVMEPVETPVPQEPTVEPAPRAAYLAVARGADPRALTMAALAAIGGIERFVKRGAEVVIKPNICTDYYPFEYGATTNPEVVAVLVELALGAGAKRVKVMDFPFGGSPESAYARSGIADAVNRSGGQMVIMNRAKFRETAIPEGRSITSWNIYQEILDADVVINAPIAKHHSLARLSLGGKNLLGCITDPGGIHADLNQRIADLVSVIRPELTVVDAIRTLMRNGPTGGNLDDVRMTNTVIASHDSVAADAYAVTLFDVALERIGYVVNAADMGIGTLDLQGIEIEEIAV